MGQNPVPELESKLPSLEASILFTMVREFVTAATWLAVLLESVPIHAYFLPPTTWHIYFRC
jgi:hypothetical protein